MEAIERVSHPSAAQVEALVQFLEERPSLGKGFLRNAGAKAKALGEWEALTLKLNSIGGGAIKPAKKWIKYWSDKKSAVKKKAGARAAAMRRTGGGIEEVPELSEIEERIVALMGGGGFATGDAHLRMQVFDEPTPDLSDSPSILVGHSEQHLVVQPGPSTSTHNYPARPSEVYVDNADMDLHPEQHLVIQPQPSTSTHNYPASPFEVYVDNADLELHPIGSGHESHMQEQLNQPRQPPLQPVVVVQTHTHQRERTPQPRYPEFVEETVEHNADRSPRRRRIRAVRRSPPSQRRSQFTSITEKFLILEQQRMALERRVITIMEQNIEVNRLTAQANIALGEGLKALAEVIKKN